MSKIKILVVEDDVHGVNSIIDLLSIEDDIIIEATAMNRFEAVKVAKHLKIGAVIMDINLDGNRYDGIYAAADISQINQAKIIMLASLDEKEIIFDSFTVGAINSVSRYDCSKLADAIRSTKADISPYQVLLHEYQRLKQEEQLKDLTNSERAIFDLYERGFTRSQIQGILYKSENTVKAQIKSILRKLDEKSLKNAIKKIKHRGLIIKQ